MVGHSIAFRQKFTTGGARK